MISLAQIHSLIERPRDPESPVLSLYLNVDPSDASNLNRGFESRAKTLLAKLGEQLDGDRKDHFEKDSARVMEFVSGYTPAAKGIVVFCDVSKDFFWNEEVRTPILSEAFWDESPYIRPLLEQLDEYERYGVVLVDSGQARLFSVFMGEITEHEVVPVNPGPRRTKSSGSQHGWSQMHIQRKADVYTHWHLKHVAEEAVQLANRERFDRLILAGPTQVTKQLQQLLPKRLSRRVVASLPLQATASPSEILDKTQEVEHEVERQRESELVDDLITTAAKDEGAVTGIERTVEAAQEGRLWQLLYAGGLQVEGRICQECRALTMHQRDTCPFCQEPLEVANDMIDLVAKRTFELGGRIEQVKGEAAEKLKEAGGIGGLLRF
jgi:peptide subunit release factor 1 (eRF1)